MDITKDLTLEDILWYGLCNRESCDCLEISSICLEMTVDVPMYQD